MFIFICVNIGTFIYISGAPPGCEKMMIPIVGGGIMCIREGILPYLPTPASIVAGNALYYTSGFS